MVYRFFVRVLGRGNTRSSERQRQQFDPHRNGSGTSSRKKNLDQIEDAEYEDITEKEKK